MVEREDALTRKGARRLVSKIKKFWAQYGVEVDVWVEPVVYTSGKHRHEAPIEIFQIRSNIDKLDILSCRS